MNITRFAAVTGSALLLTALGGAAVFAAPASAPRTMPTPTTTAAPAANQEGAQGEQADVENAADNKDDGNVADKNGADEKDMGQSGPQDSGEKGQTGENDGEHSD